MAVKVFFNDLKSTLFAVLTLSAFFAAFGIYGFYSNQECLAAGGKLEVTGSTTMFADERIPTEECIPPKTDSR